MNLNVETDAKMLFCTDESPIQHKVPDPTPNSPMDLNERQDLSERDVNAWPQDSELPQFNEAEICDD